MYQIRLVQSFSPFTTTPIYSPDMQDSLPVESGHFTLELNEGGSLEFTLPYDHPYYEALTPLSSYVQVTEDGEEIFYGRIYDRSEPTLTGRISYQAEGALSFLQDSEISPESKDSQGNYNTRTLSAEAFFRWCIQQHNADVADPRRQFTVGNVTASRKGETDEYQITSFTETKSALSQYILDRYGGVLRVRPGSNGTHYIDWVQDYGVTNPQPVEIGSNVTDMTNAISGDGVFTVLRPVGANGLTLTPNTINVFPSDKVSEYGRIVKTVTFGDADTEAKLRAKAATYISRIEKKMTKETQVSLVDFHFLDGNIPKIRVGHMFSNIRGMEGETMTVFNWDQDIISVDKGQFTLKNKKDLDSVTDGRVKGGTISKSSARGSKVGGLALKYYHEGTDEAMLEVKKLTATVDEAEIKIGELDLDIQGTADIAADAWTLSTNNYEVISRVENRVDTIEDVSIAGMEVRIQNIEGTAVIKNSDMISTVAGEFEIWEDQATGKKTVHLKDGAELAVDKNGAYITVGGLNDTLGQHEEVIAGQSLIINEMTGSALWTTRDNITNVVGEFDVIWIPDPDNPGEFIKKLKIQSGGGVVINRNNTEFGLFDEGNLTGGVIVDKINEDDYETTIKGSRVIIGDRLTDDDLSSWAQDAAYGRGVFAKYLTVKQLTAEEITTLLAQIGNATISNLAVTNNISAQQGYVESPSFIVDSGGSIQFNGTGAGERYSLGMNDIKTMLVKGEVSGNTLKLWKKGDPDNSPSITFSKATTLSGEWSGSGTLTITAKQNNSSVATWIRALHDTPPYKDENDNNKWKIDITAYEPNVTPPSYVATHHTINIDGWLSKVYATGGTKITQNGTYTPSSPNIGFSEVVVDVDASVTGAWEQSNPQSSANPYNKYTVRNAKSQVVLSETINVSQSYDSATHKYTATVSATNRSSVITAVTGTEAYAAGWSAAYDKVTMPGAGTGTTFDVLVPPSDVDGDAVTKTFTISKGTPGSSGYAAVSLGGTVVGRIDISNWYTAGRNDGWGAAYGKVSMPGAGTGTTFDVLVPPSDVDGDAVTKTFTITKGTPGTSGYAAVSLSGTVVGRIDISNWYTTGKTDGGDAAGLTIDTTNHKIKRSTNSSVKEYDITVSCDTPSYNTTTHKYSFTARAKASTTEVNTGSTSTGTEAYDAGIAYEKTLVRTRFGYVNRAYYIEAYENTSGSPSISGTMTGYKLGLSGTTVQIQNTSGTRISDTATYVIPLEEKTITANNATGYTPSAGYVGFSKVKVAVDEHSISVSGFTSSGTTDPGAAYTNITGISSSSSAYTWFKFNAYCGSSTKLYKIKVSDTARTIVNNSDASQNYQGILTAGKYINLKNSTETGGGIVQSWYVPHAWFYAGAKPNTSPAVNEMTSNDYYIWLEYHTPNGRVGSPAGNTVWHINAAATAAVTPWIASTGQYDSDPGGSLMADVTPSTSTDKYVYFTLGCKDVVGNVTITPSTWKARIRQASNPHPTLYTLHCSKIENAGSNVNLTFTMSLSASQTEFRSGTNYSFYR